MLLLATVSLASSTGPFLSITGRTAEVPQLIEKTITLADIETAKGSGIAATDVVECLELPADTLVWACGVEVTVNSDATTQTVDVGITGVDVDKWVDGGNTVTGGHLAAGTNGITSDFYHATAADTIDMLIATQTGTPTVGTYRVWADISKLG